ncbi:unnamed protein product, partial [Rotaria sp. Silwood2]
FLIILLVLVLVVILPIVLIIIALASSTINFVLNINNNNNNSNIAGFIRSAINLALNFFERLLRQHDSISNVLQLFGRNALSPRQTNF